MLTILDLQGQQALGGNLRGEVKSDAASTRLPFVLSCMQ